MTTTTGSPSITTVWPADAPAPKDNVVTALAKVMAELGGIDKMTAAERAKRGMGGGDTGINYAYRGIDQIAGAAQPLLGKHGVVIVPSVQESRTEQITVNNRPWTDTWVRVTWTVYGPGGVHDKVVAVTEGLGRDNADKGPNKAMTAAAKNLLLRLFMIGDSTDDSDGHAPERDEQPTEPKPLSEQWIAAWRGQMQSEGFEADQVLWTAFGNAVPDPLMPEHIPAMRDAVARMRQAREAPELHHDEKAGGTTGAEEFWSEPQLPIDGESRPVTQQQVGRIKAEYTRLEYDRDRQLKLTRSIVGRRIDSHNQLTYDEAEKLLESIRRIQGPARDPD